MSILHDTPTRFESSGEASANATYRVSFPTNIGESLTTEGVGKRDKKQGDVHATNNQYAGLDDGAVGGPGGTQVLKDLNLITRSVASSQVSKELGLSCVADEAYAKTPAGNDLGVSAFCSGSPVARNVKVKTPDSPEPVEFIHTTNFNYQSAEVQKGLYDLEAVDYLTGQIDRHAGNIFIDPTNGQVTGIDNDLCFGSKPIEIATQDSAVGAKAVGKPPLFFHEDTAAQIEAMTPDKLREILSNVDDGNGNNKLSPAEIEAAVGRLNELKDAIAVARAEGRVVKEFNEETHKASVKHHERERGTPSKTGIYSNVGNYVGRCQAELDFAKKNVEEVGEKGPDRLVEPAEVPEMAPEVVLLKDAKQQVVRAEVEAQENAHAELDAAKQELKAFDDHIAAQRAATGKRGMGPLSEAEKAERAQIAEQRAVLKANVDRCQDLVNAIENQQVASAQVDVDRASMTASVSEVSNLRQQARDLDSRIKAINRNADLLTGLSYSSTPEPLSKEEALLINRTNPPGAEAVKEGEILTRQRLNELRNNARGLRNTADKLTEQRDQLLNQAKAHSSSQGQVLKGSLQKLGDANENVKRQVARNPGVIQAKEGVKNLQAQQREVRLEQAAQRKIEEAAKQEQQAQQELQQRREESPWQNSAKQPPVPPPLPGANDADNNNEAEIKPKSTRAALIGTNRQRGPSGPNALRNSTEMKDVVEQHQQPASNTKSRSNSVT